VWTRNRIGGKEMSLCDCQCGVELEKLSQENKTIQKALLEIKLMIEEKKQSRNDEVARQREKTW
jgi:hypothetical protein